MSGGTRFGRSYLRLACVSRVRARKLESERVTRCFGRVSKHQLGKTLLLGLELLVAADVVRTVALEPTLDNVATLGLLVFIRTFLSWSLTIEIEGRWPWQARDAKEKPDQPARVATLAEECTGRSADKSD